jgi:hypothetical protein
MCFVDILEFVERTPEMALIDEVNNEECFDFDAARLDDVRPAPTDMR